MLGYEDPESYLENECYFGCTVGRVCNRIAEGRLRGEGLDEERKLDINNGPNHLHGGKEGWSFKIWSVEELHDEKIVLQYKSGDGEGNYPSAGKFLLLTTFIGIQKAIATDRAAHTLFTPFSPSLLTTTPSYHSHFALSHGKGNVRSRRLRGFHHHGSRQ